ncbi:hypothetical protein PHLCEN_2v12718 [Hermanssonia centrifuga]|uniref:WSC domain-containing protein n=1 Tax=Hermanssonia centrifuga TaxID=98765 RepID=A0A2R6NGH8_9APHY|nr:hypothetical protein PHLCEN_2v12718 [Hermanssonia centrifuga]
MVFSKLFAFVTASLLVAPPSVSAYWIFGGTRPVVTTRLDPIVDPGEVSSHVHSVVGGSRFSPNYDYDDLITSQCSTITVQADKSNYWAPQLYYWNQTDDTYTPIPTSFNIYYLPRPGPKNETIQAFPTGLRMVAGSPLRRTNNDSNFADQAISYQCLDYNTDHTGDPDWEQRADFFDHQCPDAMRAQITFPPCWDGVNLDSADHSSHMAYPIQAYNTGDCPDSHPVHLVSIFYEMFVSVDQFPYVPGSWIYSFGDNIGLGLHGDFQDGWTNKTLLQDALDNCPDANGSVQACPPLNAAVNDDIASACHAELDIVDESVGLSSPPLAALPGCNPLWVGNGTKPTCDPTPPTPGMINSTLPLPSGWTAMGCVAEGTTGRALASASTTNPAMTPPLCANFCDNLGYPYSGVEYGDECYCVSTIMCSLFEHSN